MGLTIWKYPLRIKDDPTLSMPAGARVLCVQVQGDQPMVWAMVDPLKPTEVRRFRLAGTGHPIDTDPGRYVGTFQAHNGALVFHLFESPR